MVRDLRRADERHRLRHRRPARLARGGGRRPAGPDPHRRSGASRRPLTRLEIDIPEADLAARSPATAAAAAYASPARGWQSLYVDTVQQADTGADLNFLVGASGAEVSRESH